MIDVENRLIIPPLYYPFPVGISRDSQEIEEKTFDWLAKHGLLERGGEMEKTLRELHAADFIGRLFHDMHHDGYFALSMFYAWIYVVDQGFCEDGVFRDDPAGLAELSLWLREIFYDPYDFDWSPLCRDISASFLPQYAELCHRLGTATQDMCRHIERLSTPSQYMQFVDGVTYYFLGVTWQTGRLLDDSVTLCIHAAARRSFTAVMANLALWGPTTGVVVPPDEINNVDVRRMLALTSQVAGIFNDIISYGNDKGVLWGLPGLLVKRGLSEQDAISEAVRINNEKVAAFIDLRRKIVPWASPELLRYVDAMGTLMRGQPEWSIRTKRYAYDKYFDFRGCTDVYHASAPRAQLVYA
ncbi:terpene synthase family protein [Burkholderia ubonensis]|uniref:terpene synthase family protein n=1 Tax=Burkholderia ubonensis TaxID=101571 RepID=UPI000A6D8D8E|nr:hypothetical protein [Burkholderia ubonensis]